MTKFKKILKALGLILLACFIIIQFFHTEKNLSNDYTNDISKVYPVPDEIREILRTSCDDCHSNATVYPWYSNIQPVDWWLQDHVNEGKKELNISEFGTYRPYRQYRKFEEIIEQVKEEEMPLPSYLIIHQSSKLSADQRLKLTNWAQSMRDQMVATFPPDSLINPKKRKS